MKKLVNFCNWLKQRLKRWANRYKPNVKENESSLESKTNSMTPPVCQINNYYQFLPRLSNGLYKCKYMAQK